MRFYDNVSEIARLDITPVCIISLNSLLSAKRSILLCKLCSLLRKEVVKHTTVGLVQIVMFSVPIQPLFGICQFLLALAFFTITLLGYRKRVCSLGAYSLLSK